MVRMPATSKLAIPLRVKRLIQVDPEHPREKCQHRGKWQEQDNGPESNLVHTPSSHRPQYGPEPTNHGKRETVTDVHGAKKIPRFAIEEQTAMGAAVIHLRQAPINAGEENLARPAARTELPQNAAYGGWAEISQALMILDFPASERPLFP